MSDRASTVADCAVSALRSAAAALQSANAARDLGALLRDLLPRLRIAVVHGGDKTLPGAVLRAADNPRPWKSYRQVAQDIAESLTRLGCRSVSLIPDDMRLTERLRDASIDLVWLNTGGVQGRGAIAHAAAHLEMLGVPYIGHDPLTSGVLDAKHVFKRQMVGAGLPTAPFLTCPVPARGLGAPVPVACRPGFQRVFAGWDGGFVVKPVSGRASLHVHHVASADALDVTVAAIQDRTGADVLIEGFLPGREFCIAVGGTLVAR
ncbi:MAG: hypothetical protein AAF321_09145, partial [Pseudomonadota bacterium]